MWQFLAWLLCVIIGLIPAIWVYKKDKKSNLKFFWLPALLRGLSFFLIAVLLFAPNLRFQKNEIQKPTIVLLSDNSSSMRNSLSKDSQEYDLKLQNIIKKADKSFEFESYYFDELPYQEATSKYSGIKTNIEEALSRTILRYSGQNLGAIILSSDGIYNEGLDPLYVNNINAVPIYTIAVGDSTMPKDISVLRIFANKTVIMGNSFEVAADIKFSKFPESEHSIQLSEQGKIIQQKHINVLESEEVKSISFEVQPRAPGMYRYSIFVPIANDEKSVINNRLDFYIQVISNATKVLLVNGGSHPDLGIIRKIVKATEGYTIETAPPNILPGNFNDYNIIITHQPHIQPIDWNRIVQSNVALWHILGNNTSQNQIQILNEYGNFLPGSEGTFYKPSSKKNFGNFRLPLNAENVFSKLPPLESNVSRASIRDKANVILNSDNGEMWYEKSGAQPIAITVGEGLWRWSMYEYKENKNNKVIDELIRQTLMGLNIPKLDKPFQVALSKRLLTDNENVSFTAELRNNNGQLVNNVSAKLTISDSSGNKKEYEFDKLGDIYNLTLTKLSHGTYHYEGNVHFQGKMYTDQGTFAIENTPLEQINTQADYQMMFQLAQQTNAKFYTLSDMEQVLNDIQQNTNIKEVLHTRQINKPWIHYKWLFGVILILLTLEWIYRKYWQLQ